LVSVALVTGFATRAAAAAPEPLERVAMKLSLSTNDVDMTIFLSAFFKRHA
jgi:hypothetical protein